MLGGDVDPYVRDLKYLKLGIIGRKPSPMRFAGLCSVLKIYCGQAMRVLGRAFLQRRTSSGRKMENRKSKDKRVTEAGWGSIRKSTSYIRSQVKTKDINKIHM